MWCLPLCLLAALTAVCCGFEDGHEFCDHGHSHAHVHGEECGSEEPMDFAGWPELELEEEWEVAGTGEPFNPDATPEDLDCDAREDPVLSRFLRDVTTPSTVLEVTCGLFGTNSAFMAAVGHDVTCVDVDEGSLEFARESSVATVPVDLLQPCVANASATSLPPSPPPSLFVTHDNLMDPDGVLAAANTARVAAGRSPADDGFDFVVDTRLFATVLMADSEPMAQAYAGIVASLLRPGGQLLVVVGSCSTGADMAPHLLAAVEPLAELLMDAGLHVVVCDEFYGHDAVPRNPSSKYAEGAPLMGMMNIAAVAYRPSPDMTAAASGALPPLDTAAGVDQATLAGFRERGHGVFRGVFSREELRMWRRVVRSVRTNGQWDPFRSLLSDESSRPAQVDKPFVRVHNLFWDSPELHRFVTSRRLGSLAAKLLGVDAVRVYQDSAFFKDPGDVDSPWHQDNVACPLDTSSQDIVTFWIPLEATTADMGTLDFADKSHEYDSAKVDMDAPLLSYRYLNASSRLDALQPPKEGSGKEDDDNKFLSADQDFVDRHFTVTPGWDLDLGDITAHYGWTIHHAPGNGGSRTRQAYTVSFFADGATLSDDFAVERRNPVGGGECGGVQEDPWEDLSMMKFTAWPPGNSDCSVVLSTSTNCTLVCVSSVTLDDRATWVPLLEDGVLRPGAPVPAVEDPRLPLAAV